MNRYGVVKGRPIPLCGMVVVGCGRELQALRLFLSRRCRAFL